MRDNSPGRRAAAYWFVDGLADIVLGLVLFILGGAGFLWRIYAPHPWIYDLGLVGGGIILFLWKERALLDFLKSRVTYPRTGYAEPPSQFEPSPSLVTLSLSPAGPEEENVTSFDRRTVMAIYWVFYSLALPIPPARWVTPLTMPVLALMLYGMNRKSERPYRWWSALILALTALVFLWVDVPPIPRGLLPIPLAGAWLVAQGVWTLVNYLRANPSPRTPEGVRA
jgi:hypothetical protein